MLTQTNVLVTKNGFADWWIIHFFDDYLGQNAIDHKLYLV